MSEITNAYEQLPEDGAPKALVILLHGLGSNGRDLISLSPYFAAAGAGIGFVSPDAPFPCDMVPPGYPDSYQWFSLQNRDPHEMQKGVETVFPILKSFIEEQAKKYELPLSKIALCGFSQGTMMSLYTAPRMESAMAGVLGYSGAMIGAAGEHKLPIRLVHGEADDVVPVAAYAHARETLEAAGYDVSGHTTPGLQHSIDEEGIRAGIAFLKQVLSE